LSWLFSQVETRVSVANGEFGRDTDRHLYDRQNDKTEYKHEANVHAEQLHDQYRAFDHHLLNVLGAAYVDHFVQHESQYEGEHLQVENRLVFF